MTGPEESGSHPTAPHRPDACCSHLGYGLGSSPLSISQFEFSTRSPVLLFPPPPPLFSYLLYSVSAPQALSSRRRTGFGSQRTEERMGHCWHPEHVQGGEEENTKAEAAAVLGRGERGRKTSSFLISASGKENNSCQPLQPFFPCGLCQTRAVWGCGSVQPPPALCLSRSCSSSLTSSSSPLPCFSSLFGVSRPRC